MIWRGIFGHANVGNQHKLTYNIMRQWTCLSALVLVCQAPSQTHKQRLAPVLDGDSPWMPLQKVVVSHQISSRSFLIVMVLRVLALMFFCSVFRLSLRVGMRHVKFDCPTMWRNKNFNMHRVICFQLSNWAGRSRLAIFLAPVSAAKKPSMSAMLWDIAWPTLQLYYSSSDKQRPQRDTNNMCEHETKEQKTTANKYITAEEPKEETCNRKEEVGKTRTLKSQSMIV